MYCVNLKPDLNALQVGAKAANLGKALSMGWKVPHAFVITRTALTFFLEETGIRDQVEKFLKDDQLYDRVTRKQAFEGLRSSVLAASIPEKLRRKCLYWRRNCLSQRLLAWRCVLRELMRIRKKPASQESTRVSSP